MLDYKLLQALDAVVDQGGFERAAAVLHLTQSAVSQRVKALEEQVGQVLVARTTPPEPTLAGRAVLKHFRKVRRLEGDLAHELDPDRGEGFASLPVAVNADSLATWFLGGVDDFVKRNGVVLDLRVADQDLTHDFLRQGEVLGCVSSEPRPFQGCAVHELGAMRYRLYGSRSYKEKYFPDGVTPEALLRAPSLIFNRADELHVHLYRSVFGFVPGPLPAHYLPSAAQFPVAIARGFGCGMIPDEQRAAHQGDDLVDLMPGHFVDIVLYWHVWNIRSALLEKLNRAVVDNARGLLARRAIE